MEAFKNLAKYEFEVGKCYTFSYLRFPIRLLDEPSLSKKNIIRRIVAEEALLILDEKVDYEGRIFYKALVCDQIGWFTFTKINKNEIVIEIMEIL